jgi:hypothetical protein
MSLEIFARQSLAQFAIIYGEIFAEGKGKAINPSEIETLMWGRMCAKEAGIVKTGFKIPYDNIKRAKVTLPYMPDDINYTGCCAIKKNGGLYTPCCGKVAEDTFYCKSCSVDKDGDSKEIEFGTIDDREQNVEDGRFAPITFAEWMKAHKNMSLPEVYAKLREAGIALEIPASELTCRELPKRRKGRPAKSDDSVVDEDSVPKKSKKSPKASPAASEDEAPKKAKKVKEPEPESESESEVEAPKSKKAEPKKAKSPAASEDETPKAKKAKAEAPKAKVKSPAASEEPKKAKKTKAESEDEAPKKKVKSPAASEDEKPKANKAKEPEPKKAKSPAASDDEAPKKKATKADKPKEPKKKPSSGSESETPKKTKKAKVPEPEPEPEAEVEEAEDEETEEQEIEIEGSDGKMHDYMLRNGKFICDMIDGRILGTVNDEGEPEWSDDA